MLRDKRDFKVSLGKFIYPPTTDLGIERPGRFPILACFIARSGFDEHRIEI